MVSFFLQILKVTKVNTLTNSYLSMCFYWENLKNKSELLAKVKFAMKEIQTIIFQLVYVVVK